MRAALLVLVAATTLAAQAVAPQSAPTFHLFFLGHDIGTETDDVVWLADGSFALKASFHCLDRSTSVDLTGELELSRDGSPTHLVVKGRNYRLFTSDSEVSVANGRAHVRDLATERDVDLAGKPFFPIDNYAPIGVQEQLIRYWLAHGQPAEIAAAPSGPIRIRPRGTTAIDDPISGHRDLDRYAIEGVVWGTETAWVDRRTGALDALTTWAGALPFEAVRAGDEDRITTFIGQAAADRVQDLRALTLATPPRESGSYALVGATVIDGTGAPPMGNATVVVRDGRIAAVGSAPPPRDLRTVDVHGEFVIPGLWDMHAHASQVDWAPVYLAGGVTTIRDMGGEEDYLIRFRDAIAGGAMGPRVLLAGLVDGSGPQAFGRVTADTPEEGIAVVRKYHDEHFDQIKIYDYVKPDVVAAICAEAHRLGMTVTGHVPRGMTAQSAVEAGFDQLAHMHLTGQSGSDASKAQIAFFKAHQTVMDPTESWNELGSHSAALPISSFQPGMTRLPPPLARMFASMPGSNGNLEAAHARLVNSLKLLKDAVDAGLLVVAGTDKGVPGFSVQRELELYVEGGMTPLEAIQTATIMPARAMKLEGDTGTIEVGKRADLVVLAANPLDDIHNIRSARLVVANGKVYDCATLWQAAGFR